MEALTALAQSLGLSYASGLSFYATTAFVGLAAHLGWIGPLPGALGILADPWIFGIAGAIAVVEVLASLVPGVATAWETLHTAVRPLAAAAVAVLAVWGSPRLAVAAALLGGALGLTTHLTKLGIRTAIDTSPEPVSNAAATAAELGVVAALVAAVWHHPWISLAAALMLLLVLFAVVRILWRMVRRAVRSLVAPGPPG